MVYCLIHPFAENKSSALGFFLLNKINHMKIIFSFALAALFLINGISAQTIQTCTTENFSINASGWTYSQGAHVGNYNNPATGCSNDRGIITPGVGGNNPCNIQTPVFTSTGASLIKISFDIIVLDANLKCNSWKDYACQTSVDIFYYVNGTKFIGIIDQVLPPNGPTNPTNVSFNFNPGNNIPTGTQYKVEMCFKPKSGIGNCIQQNTKYVFDNFSNCEIASRNIEFNERSANQGFESTPSLITIKTDASSNATKLTVNGTEGTKTISLIDTNGTVIRSVAGTTFIMFDVKDMNRGKYSVQITMENGQVINKPITLN